MIMNKLIEVKNNVEACIEEVRLEVPKEDLSKRREALKEHVFDDACVEDNINYLIDMYQAYMMEHSFTETECNPDEIIDPETCIIPEIRLNREMRDSLKECLEKVRKINKYFSCC